MNSKILAFLMISFVVIFSACKPKATTGTETATNGTEEKVKPQPVSKDGYKSESTLLIEEVDNTFRDSASQPVVQTSDNKIFIPGRRFIYNYIYINDKNQERYCVLAPPDSGLPSSKAYYYMPPSDLNERALMQAQITVLPGLGLIENVRRDYAKTAAKYDYRLYNSVAKVREQSGLVENEENVWMTPPRFMIFRMLEMNPYPYIKAPFEVGNKWTWEHTVKTRWGDPQWLVLHEPMECNYTYEITAKKKLDTALGELECFVVEGVGYNEFGETYLTSYFNTDYGFVRMEYTNIHYTKMIFDLAEVVDLDEPVIY